MEYRFSSKQPVLQSSRVLRELQPQAGEKEFKSVRMLRAAAEARQVGLSLPPPHLFTAKTGPNPEEMCALN